MTTVLGGKPLVLGHLVALHTLEYTLKSCVGAIFQSIVSRVNTGCLEIHLTLRTILKEITSNIPPLKKKNIPKNMSIVRLTLNYQLSFMKLKIFNEKLHIISFTAKGIKSVFIPSGDTLACAS